MHAVEALRRAYLPGLQGEQSTEPVSSAYDRGTGLMVRVLTLALVPGFALHRGVGHIDAEPTGTLVQTVLPLLDVLSPLPHALHDVWLESLAMVFSLHSSHSTAALVDARPADMGCRLQTRSLWRTTPGRRRRVLPLAFALHRFALHSDVNKR